MLVKVSICFFLLRLPVNKNYKRPLQGIILLLIVSHTILILLWMIQCIPLRAAWNRSVSGKCFTRNQKLQIILSQAIISVFGDYALALYPILILRKLKMSLRHKIGLAVLMGLGVVTGACGTVRAALNASSVATDATYGGITNWFWRLFEVNIGIVCACIPALVPGFKWARTQFIIRQKALQAKFGHGQRLMDPQDIPPRRPEIKGLRRPEPVVTMSESDRALLGRVRENISLGDLEVQGSTTQVPSSGETSYGRRVGGVEKDSLAGNRDHRELEGRSSPFSQGNPSSERTIVEQCSTNTSHGLRSALVGSGNPKRSLELNLDPDFKEHRSLWSRILNSFSESRLSSKLKSSLGSAS